jgi:hypothetical protein
MQLARCPSKLLQQSVLLLSICTQLWRSRASTTLHLVEGAASARVGFSSVRRAGSFPIGCARAHPIPQPPPPSVTTYRPMPSLILSSSLHISSCLAWTLSWRPFTITHPIVHTLCTYVHLYPHPFRARCPCGQNDNPSHVPLHVVVRRGTAPFRLHRITTLWAQARSEANQWALDSL